MSNLRIFVSITIAIIFFSCKKDSPQQPLKDFLNSGGSWTVSHFETHFGFPDTTVIVGTSFTFDRDGKVQVQANTGSANGTWETKNIDNAVSLLIDLEGEDFVNLESLWSVQLMTATQLKLYSGGALSPTYTLMTLIKN